MRKQLRKCINCNIYTMKSCCQNCNVKSISAHPAKFSLDDKYLKKRTQDKYV
ncbi:MAG: ribosome biogenesis protein [Nitrosopumilaceae archaeon]|nr:ribosome biogenesis protein [Nitrosopumilaceae archaeon]